MHDQFAQLHRCTGALIRSAVDCICLIRTVERHFSVALYESIVRLS